MYKNKCKLFLLILLIFVLTTSFLVACTNNTTEPDDDDNKRPAATITVNTAFDMMYDGLVNGGASLESAASKFVNTTYTIYTKTINFTITYKAYYAENEPDSIIYINIFDNKEHKERATFYYNSKDLYMVSGEGRKVITDFNSTMMFNVFFELATSLDMSSNFYGGEIARIFNRNDETLNLGLLADTSKISYTKVDENRESLELKQLDLTIIKEVIDVAMDAYFNDIGDKFDILTRKYLDFNLSRLLESRFQFIILDKINIQLNNSVAETTIWEFSGTLTDGSEYFIHANLTYDFVTKTSTEGEQLTKNKFTSVSLGKNEFNGTILIPAVSDKEFDMQIITDLNTQTNSNNKMTLRIFDAQKNNFLAMYYRDEILYLDASGFYDWVDGTVDLDAMHLPKVYFDNIDLSTLMRASYTDLLKAVLVLLDKDRDGIEIDNEELYSIIMENFTYDDKNNIYYTITEELIQKIRQDDKSTMAIISELLQVDQQKLESYLGEDFFAESKLVLSYNLDSGKIGVGFYQREDLIFQIYVDREPFKSINFPSDTTLNSDVYAKLVIPDVATIDIEAELRVDNKDKADLSKFLGALVGDVSGKNTPQTLYRNEYLYVSAQISESVMANAEGNNIYSNLIKVNVYKRTVLSDNTFSEPINLFSVYTNANNTNLLLVDYYLPLGSYSNNTNAPLRFRITKQAFKDALDELIGEDNIFDEGSAFSILEMLLSAGGTTSNIEKTDGYIKLSLLINGENDPIYSLLGIKDTNATIRTRIHFKNIDLSAIIPANYSEIEIASLSAVFANSIYSAGSKWQESVEVSIGGRVFDMWLTYTEESTEIKTGQDIYHPQAFLFGKQITYELKILDKDGTYKIQNLVSSVIVIDPAFSKTLPTKIEVVYDNGITGFLDCDIRDFDIDNINYAGYNLAGFANDFDKCDKISRLYIGENSILSIDFDVYVLVNNRTLLYQETHKETPVVGTITVDPYNYALKKMDNSNYNLVAEGIEKLDLMIRFNNVYGTETYIDNDQEKERDLIYDLENVNKFYLHHLNLDWTIDYESQISWSGGSYYSYAYYGEIKIAIRLKVMPQVVDYVQIIYSDYATNDTDHQEVKGTYTIDYLMQDTYTLPVASGEKYTLKIYFQNNGEDNAPNERIIINANTVTKDENYYSMYLPSPLLWKGRDSISGLITQDGVKGVLFGSSNTTTASFGENWFSSSSLQTVSLEVLVPSRYMSENNTQSVQIVTSYRFDNDSLEPIFGTINLSKAKFTDSTTDAYYKPFSINPYDLSAHLPESIYLSVDKAPGTNSQQITKKYPVHWVTTRMGEGQELNILKQQNGKFYLANPRTAQTLLVVYGKIGNPNGVLGQPNGYVWVVMHIENQASELQSVTYFEDFKLGSYNTNDGLATEIYKEEFLYINNEQQSVFVRYNVTWQTADMQGNETYLIRLENGKYYLNTERFALNTEYEIYGTAKNDLNETIWVVFSIKVGQQNVQEITYVGLEYGVNEITIDPYKSYSLPSGFVARLASGNEIVKKDIVWHINNGVDDNWIPSIYDGTFPRSFYGEDNKFLFSKNGGTYQARYIIGGDSEDVIRQELFLQINVQKRTIVSDLVEIFNDSNQSAKEGYLDIDYYSIQSTELLDRLLQIKQGNLNTYAGVYFVEAKTEGIFDRYTIKVDWTTASSAHPDYEFSIDRLIALLQNPMVDTEMLLKGTIYTGTVNEQQLSIEFSFSNLIIDKISFNNVRKMVAGNAPVLSVLHQNEQYLIDFDQIYDAHNNEHVLNIDINKVFALTMPNANNLEKYASPYQYISYLLSSIVLYYKNGNNASAVPSINFLNLSEAQFNAQLLGAGQQAGATTMVEIELDKLSQGSAINKMRVVITAKVDERITSDLSITAELFNEDSTERYGSEYPLPTYVDIEYLYSGTVRYDVDIWAIGDISKSILGEAPRTSIPVHLIDTLRVSGGIEGAYYNLYYNLPTENKDLHLQIYIPKKNINKTFYSATGETSLYNIVSGTLNIQNPYLYYVADSEYGMNINLIPTTILAEVNAEFYASTNINTHYIDWKFIKGVFTEDKFYTGINRVLFATATLKSYYNINDRNNSERQGQAQTIELYITVAPMDFYGINSSQIIVSEGVNEQSEIKLNTIEVDPYDDIMGYAGTLKLPTKGLTVYFNNAQTNYIFNNVVFKLVDDNNIARDTITEITYDQYGHTLNFAYISDRSRLKLRMYIPGYAYDEDDNSSGILIHVVIYRRIVEEAMLANIAVDSSGNMSMLELPSLYFIDPYNSATHCLPALANIRFESTTIFSEQRIVNWEIFDQTSQSWTNLNDSQFFYMQDSSLNTNISYGYFNNIENAYKGGIFLLRGVIRVGQGTAGEIGVQHFEVKVIVLNRSLITTYNLSHAFNDPLGGILGDIPSELSQEMFVDFDKYYVGEIDSQYYYSNWSTPILPQINWTRYISDDQIASVGGFETTVNGYVASNNTNSEYLYKLFRTEVGAEYDLLIKALMWDAYFGIDGRPLVNYSTQAANRLNELKEELEREVILATYNLLKNKLNNSTKEEELELGSYLVNGLIEMTAERLGYNIADYLDLITTELYKTLQQEYSAWERNGKKEADKNKNIVVYIEWEKIYTNFKETKSNTSADLTEYQKLKVIVYDKLNDINNNRFSNSDREYNTKLKTKLSSGLVHYINQQIYLRLYDKSTVQERMRISSILQSIVGGASTTKVEDYSNALQMYMSYSWNVLSSFGELSFADISAPAMSLEDIYRLNEDLTKEVITEILFNIYDANALDDEIIAKFVISYADYYKPYIERAIAQSWENYRDTIKDQSITNFITRTIRETVNSIVPVYYDEFGQEHKLINFDYNTFNAQDAANGDRWNTIYSYKKNTATAHVDNLSGTDETKWKQLYNAHLINGELDMIDRMNSIWSAIPSHMEDKYNEAWTNYVSLLKELATLEMDNIYDIADQKANAEIVDRIVVGEPLFNDLTLDAKNSFVAMYGIVYLDLVFDLLSESYSSYDSEKYSSVVAQGGANKGYAVHYYLYENDANIDTDIRARAKEIMFFMLSGTVAFDLLYANAELVGLTKQKIDAYLAIMNADTSMYSGVFDNSTFAQFKQAKFFLQLRSNYNGGDTYKKYMDTWYNDSLLNAKNLAYNNLVDKYLDLDGVTEPSNSANFVKLNTKKLNSINIAQNAFNSLVALKVEQGGEIEDCVTNKDAFVAENIYLSSQLIYEYLQTAPDFAYKGYLDISTTEMAIYRQFALQQFYDQTATSAEQSIISYELLTNNNNYSSAYSQVLLRHDMSDLSKQAIQSYYYYHALMAMLDKIEQDVADNTVVDSSQAQYNVYSNIIKSMILAACENTTTGNLSTEQLAVLAQFARQDFLNYVYTNAILRYTQKVNEYKTELTKISYKNQYDILYHGYAEVFDQILAEIYQNFRDSGNMSDTEGIMYQAYQILGEDLVGLELVNLYSSIEQAEQQISKEKYYDTLSIFSLSVLDEQITAVIYNNISSSFNIVYDNATEAEQDLISNIIAKELFNNDIISAENMLDILITYASLKDTLDFGDITGLINQIILDWESIYSDIILDIASDGDIQLLSAINLEIKQNYYELSSSVLDSGQADFYTLFSLFNISYDFGAIIANANRQLFSLEYLTTGDLDNVSLELKSFVVDSIRLLLQNSGAVAAANFIDKMVASNRYSFVISNTNASAEYLYHEQVIIDKLLKSGSAHAVKDLQESDNLTIYAYHRLIKLKIVEGSGNINPNSLGVLPLSYYLTFLDGQQPYSDASMQNAFDAMSNNRQIELQFYVSDNIDKDADESTVAQRMRHVLQLDKKQLTQGNESSVIGAVYVKNQYKENSQNYFKKDGIRYKFVQMTISYVDYFDQSNVSNIAEYQNANKIVIDPLYPNLPEKVQAYASTTESNMLKDVGMVSVSYSQEFFENNYGGSVGEYIITLTDSKGNTNSLVISVEYQNRKIAKMFATDNFYGGSRVSTADLDNAFFVGYYNLFDENEQKNMLKINPINDEILDTSGGKFVLPSTLGVKFLNGENAVYTNVVWDMSAIQYSLAKQDKINLRILSYEVEDAINDIITRMEFNYANSGKLRISTLNTDREVVSFVEYDNAPSYDIWNVSFESIDQSVTLVRYLKNDSYVNLGVGENNSYIDVSEAVYKLNPYDIVYPKTVSINFGDGTTVELNPAWELEAGVDGVFKLKDILLGTAQDRMIIAYFKYLGHKIRFRFVTEDIEIEHVDVENNVYIDGGILYLVVGAGSAYNQLKNNYSHMYYNFSRLPNIENWQKVPLSFTDVEVNRISTVSPRVYEGENALTGVLGWDRTNFPDMNFSPNIKFTIIVVEPKLYSYIDGTSVNTYVVNDYFSTPYDSNYQKKKDVNEPNAIGDYFIQLGANRELDTYFTIMPEQTIYKIMDAKVNFKVSYQMKSTNTRLAFNVGGDRTIYFEMSLALTPYLYTGINALQLLQSSTAEQSNLWTWTQVSPTSAEYVDAIHWPLGVSLKASELPKAKDIFSNEIISLMWDLNDVNINLATSEGYSIKGYYYDSSSTWRYLQLVVYIDKVDKQASILANLGNSYALNTTYNGRYYNLPIRPADSTLRFLRENGDFSNLSIDSYIIEYKKSTEEDSDYSATKYPLNSGSYNVRVRIVDYNIVGEIVFNLNINAYSITNNITFAGDDSGNNRIYHIYDGKNKPLVVTSGLPFVDVDNWFKSLVEKNAMVEYYQQQGYSEAASKTRAYNELYEKVSAPTKRYLDSEIANLRKELNITDTAILNATLFDRLEPNISICEVVYTITYTNENDERLTNPPVDVGDYIALFEIASSSNNGNYVFSTERISKRITISKPEVVYSLVSQNLVYSGIRQNPFINGLHNSSGELPTGVNVIYNYSYVENGITMYLTNGITNVGNYSCDIIIDGGKNFNNATISSLSVNIVPRDLHIDISDISMQYLSEVEKIADYITFSGLVGTDKARDFGSVMTSTEVESYYTLGIYQAFIMGIKINEDTTTSYTSYNALDSYNFDGKDYYKLALKSANQEGSLYRILDSNNNYVYADVINKFKNYNIYIAQSGSYEIFAEDNAIVVENDTELQQVIAGIAENQSVKLYLMGGTYSHITLNVNADISLVGCYDNNKNIITVLNGVTANAGSLTLKIIKFEAQSVGGVSLVINKNVSAVGIHDCEFDGKNLSYAKAIATNNGYKDKIYMVRTKIFGYNTGIDLLNGSLEISQCVFKNNRVGLSIQSAQLDLRITQSEFINHNSMAIYSDNSMLTMLYNTFERNILAIKIPLEENEADILLNNTFVDNSAQIEDN